MVPGCSYGRQARPKYLVHDPGCVPRLPDPSRDIANRWQRELNGDTYRVVLVTWAHVVAADPSVGCAPRTSLDTQCFHLNHSCDASFLPQPVHARAKRLTSGSDSAFLPIYRSIFDLPMCGRAGTGNRSGGVVAPSGQSVSPVKAFGDFPLIPLARNVRSVGTDWTGSLAQGLSRTGWNRPRPVDPADLRPASRKSRAGRGPR